MKRGYLPVLCFLLMAGCQKSEQADATKDIDICRYSSTMELFDGNTKTSMTPDRQVVWSKGDYISIFQGSTIADKFQVNDSCEGTGYGDFTLVPADNTESGMALPANIAVYPYQDGLSCSISDDGTSYVVSNFTYPSTQQYRQGSFPDDAFVMVAVTSSVSDKSFRFRNVSGGLHLQFCGTSKVKSIKLEGNNDEPLAGNASITAFPGDVVPSIEMLDNSSKSILLDCGDGIQLDPSIPVDFIMSVPPTIFKEGFTVTVTDTDGKEMPVRATVTNEVIRSSLLTMPVISIQNEQNPDEESSVVLTDYISATYVEFITKLAANCQYMFYNIITESKANELIYMTEEKKYEYINELVSGGYVVRNNNFSKGASYSETKIDFDLVPGGQYRVVFVCRDGKGNLSDLNLSEKFTTKRLERNSPSSNKSAISLNITDVDVCSAKLKFSYDPENTAVFHFAFIPEDIAESKSRDFMLSSVLLSSAAQNKYNLNTWWRNPSGQDAYTLGALESDTEYYVTYVAEDMDGVLGEVLYSSFRTLAPQVGANPQVEIIPEWNPETMTWKTTFKIVRDVEKFFYCVQSEDDKTNVGDLTQLGSKKYTAREFNNMWKTFVSQYGLSTVMSSTFVERKNLVSKIQLALVFAIGRNENGDECYFYDYAILTADGQVKKLKDYYPNYTEE